MACRSCGQAEIRFSCNFDIPGGSHIPLPGINSDALQSLFQQNQGGILDLVNMFSGGAIERMSILALGIMPYISASIISNLVVATTPSCNN